MDLKVIFFVIAIIFQYFNCHCHFVISHFAQGQFRVTKKIKTSHSMILYVTYKENKYVIKQKLDVNLNFWCIIQAVLADIFAHSVDTISSQRVKIIPRTTYYPGKLYKGMPAAMITVIPGRSIYHWKRAPKHVITKKTKLLLKHFLARQREGINLRILDCMNWHKDLPVIAAFFTLLGYFDGHRSNIFYDQDSNRFSIIDMDSSFDKNLAQGSYVFMKKYYAKKTIKKEIQKSLCDFSDALESLMQNNPISEIKKLTVEICNALVGNNNGERQFKKRILQVELFLQESYEWSKKLIYLIRNGKEPEKGTHKRIV
jgi:hypothetical protein